MDNNQQELESLILEKRKIEIPNLSSHPSYQAHGEDATVDFSVDDIYDAFKSADVITARPVTKVSKISFECDEVINIVVLQTRKETKESKAKAETKLIFDCDETITVINTLPFEEQVAQRTEEVVFEKPVIVVSKLPDKPDKPDKEVILPIQKVPLFIFKGKLSEADEPIYENAFRSDSDIAALETRERPTPAPRIKPKQVVVAPKDEAVPDTPEIAEVKTYLSTYPTHKIYRGIITDAQDEFISKDSFNDPQVIDEILGRSKEVAIEKAKQEVSLAIGKDASDEELFNYAKAPLASEEEISELESKHMALYSSISKIQEIQSANDFKSAYQIQDRISYLLNHRTLLYKSLTQELIGFIDSITKRLDTYYEHVSAKYAELKIYNEKISGIKNYKWKADESMKIIQENKEEAQKEFDRF